MRAPLRSFAQTAGVESAAVVEQRVGLVAVAAAFDFADKDDVVAFFVAAAVKAFKRGHGALDQRRAMLAGVPVHAGVAVNVFGGELVGQRGLFGTEHVNRVVAAGQQRGHRARFHGQAPQHQGGRQRHRVEGADRQTHQAPGGVDGGDDRHTRGKLPQGVAKLALGEVGGECAFRGAIGKRRCVVQVIDRIDWMKKTRAV